MKIVLQRVMSASCEIDGSVVGRIQKGMVLFLGFGQGDSQETVQRMLLKCVQLRIFDDEQKKPNLSIEEVAGEILAISQFTLYADTKKGRRPSYIEALAPKDAENLYLESLKYLKDIFPTKVQSGIFGADMKIELVNDGPYTLVLDSEKNI